MNTRQAIFVATGLLLVILASCQNEANQAQQNVAELESAAINAPRFAEADSLLKLVNDRLRRRQMAGIDSLLATAATLYKSGQDDFPADSLAQLGFLKTQTYLASYYREIGQLDQCMTVWNEHFPRALQRFGRKHSIVATFLQC